MWKCFCLRSTTCVVQEDEDEDEDQEEDSDAEMREFKEAAPVEQTAKRKRLKK